MNEPICEEFVAIAKEKLTNPYARLLPKHCTHTHTYYSHTSGERVFCAAFIVTQCGA